LTAEERLAQLGLTLPAAPRPLAAYVTVARVADVLYTAGVTCMRDGQLAYSGKLGTDLTVAQGQDAARIAALNQLSILQAELGTLDRVVRVARLVGYVASAPGFGQQPEVLDGASELLVAVLGEAGRHARSVAGANELPRNCPVLIDLTVHVR